MDAHEEARGLQSVRNEQSVLIRVKHTGLFNVPCLAGEEKKEKNVVWYQGRPSKLIRVTVYRFNLSCVLVMQNVCNGTRAPVPHFPFFLLLF